MSMDPPDLVGGFYGLGLIGRPNITQVSQTGLPATQAAILAAQQMAAVVEQQEGISTDGSTDGEDNEGGMGEYTAIGDRQTGGVSDIEIHFNDGDENKGYNGVHVKQEDTISTDEQNNITQFKDYNTIHIKPEAQVHHITDYKGYNGINVKLESNNDLSEQKYSQFSQHEAAHFLSKTTNNNNNNNPVSTQSQNLLSAFQLLGGAIPTSLQQQIKPLQNTVIPPIGFCSTTSAPVVNTSIQLNQMPLQSTSIDTLSTTTAPFSVQNVQPLHAQGLYQNTAFMNGTSYSIPNLLSALNQQLASYPLQFQNTTAGGVAGALNAINQAQYQNTTATQQQQQQQQLPPLTTQAHQYYQSSNLHNQVPSQSPSPHTLSQQQPQDDQTKEQKKKPRTKRVKKSDLEEMKTDKNFVTCPVCGNQYSKYYYMLKHRHVHMGKTYDCPTCGRTFTHPHNMYRHKRRHDDTNKYLYKCQFPKCGMNFKTQPGLKKHESLKHNLKGSDEQRKTATQLHIQQQQQQQQQMQQPQQLQQIQPQFLLQQQPLLQHADLNDNQYTMHKLIKTELSA